MTKIRTLIRQQKNLNNCPKPIINFQQKKIHRQNPNQIHQNNEKKE